MITKRRNFCYKKAKVSTQAAGDFAPGFPPETRGVFKGGKAPPFGQKSVKIHKNTRLNDIFVILEGT